MLSKMLRAVQKTKTPVSFVTAITGTSLVAGLTSVTFTGHQTGDLLIAIGGSQQSTDPTFTSGWTKIISSLYSTGPRIAVAVYKFATSSANDTVIFTGTGTSASSYSSGIVFRNASGIGASSFNNTTTFSLSFPVNALTLQKTNGTSAALCGVYINSTVSSYNGGITRSSGGIGYKLNLTSFPATTGVWSATNPNNSLSVEILA